MRIIICHLIVNSQRISHTLTNFKIGSFHVSFSWSGDVRMVLLNKKIRYAKPHERNKSILILVGITSETKVDTKQNSNKTKSKLKQSEA